VRELGADLPRRELAPHDDREDPGERLALAGRALRSSVLGDEPGQDLAAVPDPVLTDMVDALHTPGASRFTVRVAHVEHRVRKGHVSKRRGNTSTRPVTPRANSRALPAQGLLPRAPVGV